MRLDHVFFIPKLDVLLGSIFGRCLLQRQSRWSWTSA